MNFHVFNTFISSPQRVYSDNDQLPVGLIAQLSTAPEFSYTAVSTKVVQKKRKSVRDNTER